MSNNEQIFSFLLELTGMHNIKRQIYLPDQQTRESDSEHMWHLALFILCFENRLPPQLDRLKLLKLVLTHDIPELYAGDTFAFDEMARVDKKEREAKAAQKLYAMLPDEQHEQFMKLFEEYEQGETLEAKYAAAFDKLQAFFISSTSDGKALKENNITTPTMHKYARHLMQDPLTKELYDVLIERIKKTGIE